MPEGWFRVPHGIGDIIAACDHGDAGLVYTLLCSHVDAKGVCWPSIDHLVKVSHKSRRQVQAMIKLLESKGFIEIKHRQTSSIYRLVGYAHYAHPKSAVNPDTQNVPTSSAQIEVEERTICVPAVHNVHTEQDTLNQNHLTKTTEPKQTHAEILALVQEDDAIITEMFAKTRSMLKGKK